VTSPITIQHADITVNVSIDVAALAGHVVPPILTALEAHMATEAELLTALTDKVDDLVDDVRAALATLAADRDKLGPDGQAAFDTLNAKVDAFDAEIGDADGSDGTPPVEG